MEVVVENPEQTSPKGCVLEPGSPKPRDSRGKTLEDEPKSAGPMETVRENGARISENGDEELKRIADGSETFSGKGVRVEHLNDPGSLEDSEMNGVSSLLKMKQHFSEKENANSYDVLDSGKDVSVEHVEESEEEEEGEHGFQVGDFVWGKIKTHPWWPGQIYNSSDASDLALKVKRKGRLLVAYFGDGTFAWCRPSQLIPFEENFREFSKTNSSRGFVSAVEEAVEEMGRHVERSMTERSGDDGAVRPVAVNYGIKEGVVVPDVRREIVSLLTSFEPREILGGVKTLAKTLAFSDLLELEVSKRKLSAFYQSKGGYSLVEYHEAQSVPGLEDRDVVRAVKSRGPKGSSEEDGLPSPVKPHQRSLAQCSGFPDHRLHHKRKQKSIAEILETDGAARVRVEAEVTSAGASGTGGKKRKRSGELKGIAEILETDMAAQAKAEAEVASAGASSTGRRKRKRSDEVKDVEKVSASASTTPRRKVSKLSDIESAFAGSKREDGDGKEKTLSRKRKKRVAGRGDNASENKEETTTRVEESDEKKALDVEEDGDDSTTLASLREKIKISVPRVETDSGNGEAKVQTPNDSLSRERKRSKYLSPPYTSEVGWKTRKSQIEAESSKVSGEAPIGERTTSAAESLAEANGDKPGDPSELDSGHQELPDELRKAIDFMRSGAPAKKVKDQIRATALSPQYPKGDSSDHLMREFISIYRRFAYHDEANNKVHREQTLDKETEQNGKVQNETSNPSRKKDRKSARKTKVKHRQEENKAETEKQDSCTELFITFGPGSNLLPKKDDLIKIYGKFGPLDEEKTDMFNSFYARVAFMNRPNAEAALESSRKQCPFATVSPAVHFGLKKPESTRIELEYVREKLDEMRSMLGRTDGGMTEELKVKLEEEMRKLLEKVGMMVVVGSS